MASQVLNPGRALWRRLNPLEAPPVPMDIHALYPLLFRHYVDPCLLVDPVNGRILEANCAAVRFLREKRERLAECRLPELVAAGDAALAELLEVVRAEGRAAASVQVRVGGGQRRPAEVIAQSVDTPDGTIILFTLRGPAKAAAASGEVTEVARLHHRLKAFRELFYRLNNPIQELLSTVELQGNVRLRRVAGISRWPRFAAIITPSSCSTCRCRR